MDGRTEIEIIDNLIEESFNILPTATYSENEKIDQLALVIHTLTESNNTSNKKIEELEQKIHCLVKCNNELISKYDLLQQQCGSLDKRYEELQKISSHILNAATAMTEQNTFLNKYNQLLECTLGRKQIQREKENGSIHQEESVQVAGHRELENTSKSNGSHTMVISNNNNSHNKEKLTTTEETPTGKRKLPDDIVSASTLTPAQKTPKGLGLFKESTSSPASDAQVHQVINETLRPSCKQLDRQTNSYQTRKVTKK